MIFEFTFSFPIYFFVIDRNGLILLSIISFIQFLPQIIVVAKKIKVFAALRNIFEISHFQIGKDFLDPYWFRKIDWYIVLIPPILFHITNQMFWFFFEIMSWKEYRSLIWIQISIKWMIWRWPVFWLSSFFFYSLKFFLLFWE